MGLRGKIAIVVISLILASSVLASSLTPYDPNAIDLDRLKMPPSQHNLLGTDQKGRDILTRVLYGGKISISVALLAASIAMGIGLLAGMISGYFGGAIDTAITAVLDLILSFPSLLLAIGLSIILPPGIYTSMIAIAAVGWASFARLIRGHVLKLREEPYIDAARCIGCGNIRIMAVHLLPQCIPIALVMMGLRIGGFILTEASLSFLGLGAQPPAASWGLMISSSRSYIMSAPWMVIFPGLAIAITALSCNVLGDALSERAEVNVKGLFTH